MVRLALRSLGLLALALGVIGYLVPGLPGTVFILIAAYLFARSSPRLHGALLNHPRLGGFIRDYQAGNGVPAWVKVYASVMILLFAGSSTVLFAVRRDSLPLAVLVGALGAFGLVVVLRLPTRRPAA